MRAVPLFFLIVALASPVADRADERRHSDLKPVPVPQLELPEFMVCSVLVTAYNSEESQTDDTPHETSSQTRTRRGVVAARWLPIGTPVLIPTYDGGMDVLVVEDMMPPKNWCKADLWMAERKKADEWGKRFAEVIIIGAPKGFACPGRPQTRGHKCPVPETTWGRRVAKPIRIASVK